MTNLHLLAADTPDLEVIAAAVQDGIFQIGQTRFEADARSFTLRLSRYMHESSTPLRIESGLRFDGVLKVRSQGVAQDKAEAYAVVLNLKFEETDSPAGRMNLTLAGGGVIQIEVEAIDVTLADIGDPRKTKNIPAHDG
jgi:hypothetical protein